MDKLLEKNLITRSRCNNDRRVVYVDITENGLSLLAEIDKYMDQLNYLNKLSEEEAKQLSDLLDKIR